MPLTRRIGSFLADSLQTIVTAAAIFALIYWLFAQPHQVVGDSMFPNFHNKEYILTDKISYRLRSPQAGEVIVFKAPNNLERDYIKRIIAKSADQVKIEKGRVFINGQLLIEQYLPADIKTYSGSTIKEGVEYTVPAGSYFVLGDNRTNSSDSREWGFVKREQIIGRSFIVYWPLSSFKIVGAEKTF
ncbi:signal peptidase I [Candidatus Microgenomates bacterium]|nr:signal peptidase I [Candidatus Microgenomates bacterium]